MRWERAQEGRITSGAGLKTGFLGKRKAVPYRGLLAQAESVCGQASWCPARGWSPDRSGATPSSRMLYWSQQEQRLHKGQGCPHAVTAGRVPGTRGGWFQEEQCAQGLLEGP